MHGVHTSTAEIPRTGIQGRKDVHMYIVHICTCTRYEVCVLCHAEAASTITFDFGGVVMRYTCVQAGRRHVHARTCALQVFLAAHVVRTSTMYLVPRTKYIVHIVHVYILVLWTMYVYDVKAVLSHPVSRLDFCSFDFWYMQSYTTSLAAALQVLSYCGKAHARSARAQRAWGGRHTQVYCTTHFWYLLPGTSCARI